MAYDKNIPDVLQLLRLDLGNVDYTVPSDTTIARYTIDGDYFPRYCIADVADDADTMDIQGAIEETMHAGRFAHRHGPRTRGGNRPGHHRVR